MENDALRLYDEVLPDEVIQKFNTASSKLTLAGV